MGGSLGNWRNGIDSTERQSIPWNMETISLDFVIVSDWCDSVFGTRQRPIDERNVRVCDNLYFALQVIFISIKRFVCA